MLPSRLDHTCRLFTLTLSKTLPVSPDAATSNHMGEIYENVIYVAAPLFRSFWSIFINVDAFGSIEIFIMDIVLKLDDRSPPSVFTVHEI